MFKEKIIPLFFTLIAAGIVISGCFFVPFARVTIYIFKKDFFLKDIHEEVAYVFMVLAVVSVVFSFTKYRVVSVFSGIGSFVYMIYQLLDLNNTFNHLGFIKKNIEVLYGAYVVVIGNILLITVSIINFLSFKKKKKTL